MEHIFEAALDGLTLVFSWPNILYPVAGTLLAMIVSILPGISGVTLMAVAISLTFSWEPLPIVLLFGALVGGATFMGSVTAILINVPGTAPNAATLFDGYPMAQQGRAGTAIGCSAAASALGSSVGILGLILLIPFMRQAVLAFGPPEFLMLVIWGLTTIAAVARGSLLKGLAAAGIGFLAACVGFDPNTAELRYTFGSQYLRDGLSLVPVFLGLFAVAEMIDLTVTNRATISGASQVSGLSGSIREGVYAVFRHFGLFLRSSLLGTIIGIIPGVGGTVASFMAYSQARLTSSDPSRFGKGDIRGVLAPEAANDAKDGASLVPTLAFGIPGSEGAALLLAAITLHGLTPGRELMEDKLDLVFVLIWSLFLSNWLTSIIGLAFANPFARLTVVRTGVLAPCIFLLVALSAFLYRQRFEDVILAFLCGVAGYYLKKYGWPRVTLVIALVLGSLFETNLHITLRLQQFGRIDFWSRPIVLALIILTLVSLAVPAWQARRST